jgi:hypothetical protein
MHHVNAKTGIVMQFPLNIDFKKDRSELTQLSPQGTVQYLIMTTSTRANRLRRPPSPLTLAALILAGMIPLSLQANYLINTDLSEGLAGWRGDGEAAFLNPDGTEGVEGDKGVIPVIKIALSKGEPRAVYQEYETKDDPKTQHLRIEVFASLDFKRSTFASDYSSDLNWHAGQTWYWTGEAIPNVDFWIRGAPGFLYKLANLKPGEWVTVDGRWDSPPPAEDRTVSFFVPPGDGAVYIRNPSATP